MVQDKIKYQRKPLIHKGKWYSITQDRKQKWQFESCTAHHRKVLKPQRFMFTGTQCDLWSRPVGTGHEKSKSREIPSTYFYTLIPSLHEHEASGGGHGRCLYCRLTSFSRSLQTILRINLDGTKFAKSP